MVTGEPLDFELFLFNGMIERHNQGRRGGMRPTHLLRQISAAFVARFYGIDSAESQRWGRFATLFSFAETALAMCPRFFHVMATNGQIGSRPRLGEAQVEEDEDDEEADDDDEIASPHRRKKRTQLGTLSCATEPNLCQPTIGSLLGAWSTAADFDVSCAYSLDPPTTLTAAVVSAGSTAVLVRLLDSHTTNELIPFAALVQTIDGGVRALIIQATPDQLLASSAIMAPCAPPAVRSHLPAPFCVRLFPCFDQQCAAHRTVECTGRQYCSCYDQCG